MKNKYKLFLLLIILFTINYADSQDLESNIKNQNSSFLLTDFLYIKNNSTLFSENALVKRSYISLFTENRFLMQELMTKSITTTFVFNGNAFRLSVSHFGYSKYGEFCTQLGYARLFGKKIAVGFQFHYLLQHATNYELEHSLSFDISSTLKINNKSTWSVCILNPARLKRGLERQSESTLPILIRTNFSYLMNKDFLFAIEIEKEIDRFLRLQFLSYYRISKHISLAVALQIPTPEVKTSVRLSWYYLETEVSSAYNFKTGLSSSLTLIIPYGR